MSCFLVPLVQAAATTIYRKHFCKTDSDSHPNVLKRNVPALEKMLWGGSIMLIVDHIINGELTWHSRGRRLGILGRNPHRGCPYVGCPYTGLDSLCRDQRAQDCKEYSIYIILIKT